MNKYVLGCVLLPTGNQHGKNKSQETQNFLNVNRRGFLRRLQGNDLCKYFNLVYYDIKNTEFSRNSSVVTTIIM